MQDTLISLDLFIPSLLGHWGCTVRGVRVPSHTCTGAAPLKAWASQQDDRCPLMHHRLCGELGLSPSPPTATHEGWLCHMLLVHTQGESELTLCGRYTCLEAVLAKAFADPSPFCRYTLRLGEEATLLRLQ